MNNKNDSVKVAFLAALFAIQGCAVEEEPALEEREPAAPEVVKDTRGEALRLQGTADYEIIEAGAVPEVSLSEHPVRLDDLSRAELADDLRGVRLVDGYEYAAESPDFEMADRILRGFDGASETTTSSFDEELELLQTRGLNGSDNRSYAWNNTSFPFRPTVFSEVGCSGTMIGPHTMVTAAHCVYNTSTNRWLKVWDSVQGRERWPRFSTGVDGRDFNPTPNGWHQCYDVTIPAGWVNQVHDGTSAAGLYDYAVVDFLSRCGARPGDQSGWLGTSVASEGTIESEAHYLYGYPQVAGGAFRYTGSPPNMEAEIWGMGMNPGQLWIDSPSYRLKYNHDTSRGQSGMGTWFISDGNGQVYLDGIHRGDAGPYNIGRRWDWTVRNFVEAYSQFPAL